MVGEFVWFDVDGGIGMIWLECLFMNVLDV